jgi:hypothetical protein
MAKATTRMNNILLKKGEKQYLCEQLKLKYEADSRQALRATTARESYIPLANALTNFIDSHKKDFQDRFSIEFEPNFEVSDGQLQGLFGYASHRDKFLDACYIYLHDMTRVEFLRKNPPYIFFADEIAPPQYNAQNEALTGGNEAELREEIEALLKKVDSLEADKTREIVKIEAEKNEAIATIEAEKNVIEREKTALTNKLSDSVLAAKRFGHLKWFVPILLVLIAFLGYKWCQWETIKKDMHILQYQPNQAEIDKLVGIWQSDVGSPLTRPMNTLKDIADFKDKYAINIIEITYSSAGYFKLRRWGPKFSYSGYAQYESDSLISIETIQKTDKLHEVMPKIRHSLIRLDRDNDTFRLAISVSWEHSSPEEIDDIIGIREIYTKKCNGKIAEEPYRDASGGYYWRIKTSCSEPIMRVQLDSLIHHKDTSLIGYQSFIKRDPRRK